jgi:cobalt-zinc-cadmium efflux system membrane fusion protein
MTDRPTKSFSAVRRPEPPAQGRAEAAPEKPARPAPGFRLPRWAVVAAVVVGVGALVAVLAGSGVIEQIRERVASASSDKKEENKDKTSEYPKLVRDAGGRPVRPPTILLDAAQARALDITDKTVKPAEPATKARPLPSMEGQLAYDIEGLYSVRPRFAGEVQEFGTVARKRLEKDGKPGGGVSAWKEERPIGVGDPVHGPRYDADGNKTRDGTLLAVIWSKDLADKKAAFVDALIDLHRDEHRLADLREGYERGLVPKTTYYEQRRTVQKDVSARNAAERILRTWKLTDKEIDALRREADRIERLTNAEIGGVGKAAGPADKAGHDPVTLQKWARVEVRAYHDGVIVEKNTNVGDWVDPSASPNPVFKIADLNHLAVWINAREEFRPVLQEMLFKNRDRGIRMTIRLLAEPDAEPLKGEILRIAPSLDPTQRTMLVIGRVDNPGGRLLVGLSVTATVYRKPGKGLVQIPTSALNEQDGQSVVFVQAAPGRWEFQRRRVAVAERFFDVVLVRGELTEEDRKLSEQEVARGRPPVQPLRPHERVVTHGVTMLTTAVRDLLAEEKMPDAGQ